MSVQNLAIVFGPTLFNSALSGMADTSLQNRVRTALMLGGRWSREARPAGCGCSSFFLCLEADVVISVMQAVETILEHYTDIFVEEGDDS